MVTGQMKQKEGGSWLNVWTVIICTSLNQGTDGDKNLMKILKNVGQNVKSVSRISILAHSTHLIPTSSARHHFLNSRGGPRVNEGSRTAGAFKPQSFCDAAEVSQFSTVRHMHTYIGPWADGTFLHGELKSEVVSSLKNSLMIWHSSMSDTKFSIHLASHKMAQFVCLAQCTQSQERVENTASSEQCGAQHRRQHPGPHETSGSVSCLQTQTKPGTGGVTHDAYGQIVCYHLLSLSFSHIIIAFVRTSHSHPLCDLLPGGDHLFHWFCQMNRHSRNVFRLLCTLT